MWPYSCVAYAIDHFDVYWSPSSQCDAIFRYRFGLPIFFFFLLSHFYADCILRDAILITISMHTTSLFKQAKEEWKKKKYTTYIK